MSVPDFAQGVKTPSFAMVHDPRVAPYTFAANAAKPDSASATASAAPAGAKVASASAAPANPNDDTGKFTFHDFISIINPLEHIPVVSTLYESWTGDTIKPAEKIAGDTLYGGPLGFASSVADTIFEKITGKSFGNTVLAWVDGGKDAKPQALAADTKAKAMAARSTPVTAAQAAASPAAIARTPVANAAPRPLSLFAAPPTKTPDPTLPSAATVATATPASGLAMAPASASAAAAPANMAASFASGINAGNAQALMASMQKNGIDPNLSSRALWAYRRSMGLNGVTPAVQ